MADLLQLSLLYRDLANWRVAPAFALAVITNTVCAPFFAQFAKGGNHESMRNRVSVEGKKLCRQYRHVSLRNMTKSGMGAAEETVHPQHG
jgi:hypothetical protein